MVVRSRDPSGNARSSDPGWLTRARVSRDTAIFRRECWNATMLYAALAVWLSRLPAVDVIFFEPDPLE